MAASIDGRIDATNWPSHAELRREYEQTAATYAADAWMCGRITMSRLQALFAPMRRSKARREQ